MVCTGNCANCPHLSKHTLEELKNVTTDQLMFCDFNRNGLKNVDDPRPFDPNSPNPPVFPKDWFLQSQFVGGDVKLSTELLEMKKHNDSYRPMLLDFLQSNPGSYGRVKTVPSTMRKLRMRYGFELGDIVGATIQTTNHAEIQKKVKDIKEKYKTIPKHEDDYYAKSKGGVYFAHHLSIKGPGERRMEVQIKTKRQAELQNKMHPFYKKGMSASVRSKFQQEALRLRKLDMS